MNNVLLLGDCLSILKDIDDNFIDSVVTDPPYGLSFMGKKWDYNVPGIEVWKEVLRVLKPGGHLLAFGGTRTYHRLAVAIEDAGFEIRDQLQWLYGSGFPKSHNLKGDWEGWGTALKPANEPIVLARKPLSEKTVALNVQKWGVGGLNIDGCRIGTNGEKLNISTADPNIKGLTLSGGKIKAIEREQHAQGRWPANLLLDERAAEMLDEQSGTLKSGARNGIKSARQSFGLEGTFAERARDTGNQSEASSGGASRFFYVAKASKSERNRGLEGMPVKLRTKFDGGDFQRGNGNNAKEQKAQNHHPTVKPIKLMEYLCKLVTPPGGIVLDPFMGSGTTGIAAKHLEFKFIGIEMNAEYLEIAKKRIEKA